MVNESNIAEDESISDLIDDSSIDAYWTLFRSRSFGHGHNVYNSLHIYGSTNQEFGKPGWWTHYDTGNFYKTFIIKSTCSILYMCCTKINRTCWQKGIKHASSTKKGFRGIFFGTPQHQKWYLIYVPSTRKIFSSHDVVFDEIFSSELSYTSIFRSTFKTTIGIVNSIHYIFSWINWWHYNFCSV